jgi:DNA-directed RNA polymerase specialized sigma24 family protein
MLAVPNEDERAICERFAGRIHAYGLRHLRDPPAAQDLVQHVLLAVVQALRAGRVEEPTRLDAYVLGTCRNAVMDYYSNPRTAALQIERLAASEPALLACMHGSSYRGDGAAALRLLAKSLLAGEGMAR